MDTYLAEVAQVALAAQALLQMVILDPLAARPYLSHVQ
jgi:hypothetical protein